MSGYTVECGNVVLITPRPLTTRLVRTAMAKKNCSKCGTPKPLSDFSVRRTRAAAWKKNNPGKANAETAKRRAVLAKSIPPWANLDAIKVIYEQARRQGKHVDHIVPLRSKLVCGLHCESNLQLLNPLENQMKNNKYWPDKP